MIFARWTYYFGYDKKWFHIQNIKVVMNIFIKCSRDPTKKANEPHGCRDIQVENHCYIKIHFITSHRGKILEHSKISCLSISFPIVKFFHECAECVNEFNDCPYPFLYFQINFFELR